MSGAMGGVKFDRTSRLEAQIVEMLILQNQIEYLGNEVGGRRCKALRKYLLPRTAMLWR